MEPQIVGLYTLGGGGLKRCTVCTLMKMLTFLDGPLVSPVGIIEMFNSVLTWHILAGTGEDVLAVPTFLVVIVCITTINSRASLSKEESPTQVIYGTNLKDKISTTLNSAIHKSFHINPLHILALDFKYYKQ